VTGGRREAINAFKDRLQQITIANGYLTNAGAHKIAVGEAYQLGQNDPPIALSMVILDEDHQPIRQDLKISFDLPIDVIVLVKPDLDDVIGSIEDGIADVKKAVERGDRQFDGLLTGRLRRGQVRTLPRESGSSVCGAIITYRLPISEAYGLVTA